MNILHVSAECFPAAKVGGLADVVGALPIYQNNLGFTSRVIIPYYDNNFTEKNKFETVFESELELGELVYDFQVLKLKKDLGFPFYMLRVPGLLDREQVYSYVDDPERFLAFQLGVLNWVLESKLKPSVVHCHDHHTGLIPFMMSYAYKYRSFKHIPSVLTIHNAQYQGQFSFDKLHLIPKFDLEHIGLLDWHQQINPLAAAIKCAWKITTVSPSYLDELAVTENGLEDLLASERPKSLGILNGIDVNVWNPETDSKLAKNYAINNVQSGKSYNKKILCKRFDLDPEKPLFSFIGRLVYEKGADLFPDIFYKTLLKQDVNILVLGSGNHEVESKLTALKTPFRNSYNVFIGYDENLAHQIYAGSDFLLMPSRVEPCGLNQLYALRYGTIPVVRRIGGLKDTVIDIGEADGFGICHDQATVDDVCYSIERGVTFYKDQKFYRKTRKKCMKIDHSWDQSAKEYLSLYQSLTN